MTDGRTEVEVRFRRLPAARDLPPPQRATADSVGFDLRASGINTGGPPAISLGDRQAFANNLDRFLARHAGQSE